MALLDQVRELKETNKMLALERTSKRHHGSTKHLDKTGGGGGDSSKVHMSGGAKNSPKSFHDSTLSSGNGSGGNSKPKYQILKLQRSDSIIQGNTSKRATVMLSQHTDSENDDYTNTN